VSDGTPHLVPHWAYSTEYTDIPQGFISQTWHITSHGMFAASCIGVIALVVVLEFLRRLGRENDRKLHEGMSQQPIRRVSNDSVTSDGHAMEKAYVNTDKGNATCSQAVPMCSTPARVDGVRLLRRQLLRSLLHMITFGVAYMVMLVAMYYNGKLVIENLRLIPVMMLMWSRIYYHLHSDRCLLGVLHLQLGSA